MQQLYIMVVEDEDLISIYLQEILGELGYKIFPSASSGEEALSKINSSLKKPDLVLMDYLLEGELNGVDTARVIRQSLDIPVVFLTAYSTKDILENIIQSEPYGYILKPIDERVLHATIETAIIRHQRETKLKEQEKIVRSLNTELERRVRERTSELEVSNLKLLNQIDLRGILENELRLSLDEEKKLVGMKNRMISTVSYEFRTPLTVIISSTELLQNYNQRWNEEKKIEILSRISQSADKLNGLIEDILVYSRAEEGKLECIREKVNLAAFCGDLILNLQLTTGDGRTLPLVETGQSQQAYLDQKLLGFILNNLLSNAAKYSGPDGQVELTLEWHSQEVVLQVKDTGIGIPTEDQASLFEPFYRASNVGDTSGSGFGLAIVKRSVLAHNGYIRVESLEGKGTTFRVTLPLTGVNQEETKSPLKASPRKAPQLQPDQEQKQEIVAENWWLLERIIEASSSGYIITDPAQENNPIIYVSKGFEKITGYSAAEVIGLNYLFLPGTDTDLEARFLLETALSTAIQCTLEARHYHKDGSIYWSELQISPFRNAEGKITNYVIVQNDISIRKQLENRLFYLAFHDSLTQLPNRALFVHDLERALLRRRSEGHFVAILFLDLDRFKLVNDSLGHDVGDQLLKAVADRLKFCARQEDLVSRLGGDEFTIIIDDVRSLEEATRLATRIIETLRAPFLLADRKIFVTTSIGIVFNNTDDKVPTSLMRKADIALYQAKINGKACFAVYDPTMNVRAAERMDIEEQLGHSFEQGEFTVYYQPKVKLKTGLIVGMEALVRWNSPNNRLALPPEFIPIAEETGLIIPLGRWVLGEASRQAYEWYLQGIGRFPVVMSVNLSSRQFHQTDLVDQIATILKESNLPPHLLELEITESVIMKDSKLSIKTMNGLKELGVKLAIDDFGTGYTSLNNLKLFPVNTLKIDKSFVTGLNQEPEQEVKAIIQALISTSTALKVQVMAEGVETKAQAEQLLLLGCDFGQGFYYAKAVDAETATGLLKQILVTKYE